MPQRCVQCVVRTGFSLVETVAAMAITGIVLSTSIGALQLITRHGPRLERTERVRGQAGVVIHRLRTELRLATVINGLSSSNISFITPDMDGDAVNETLQYTWSGTPGDPLTRTHNGADAEIVVADVQNFEFSIIAESISTTTDTQSGEVVLFSHEGTKSIFAYAVATAYSWSQFFTPALPAAATAWSVTRLQFKAQRSGAATGTTSVALHRALADRKPAAAAMESKSMSEAPLGSQASWQAFSYSSVAGLPPGDGLCLVLKSVASSPSCAFEYQDGLTGGGLFESGDGGGTWTVQDDKRMQVYVWGTYTTPEVTLVAGALKGVHIKVEALPVGSPGAICMDTSVTCLNRPSLAAFAIIDLPIDVIEPAAPEM